VGLRGKLESEDFAVGVKEVVEISPESIQNRFGLKADEGVARLFVGSLTRGMLGAGFLYTNHDSISLGIVLGTEELAHCQSKATPYEILEEFKSRPEIAPLIEGGQSVEYSAHVLSESGTKGMSKLFGDGIVVIGDAAGMTMNLGLTVRGMDFAIASGAIAAKAVAIAKGRNDFSANSLAIYADLLKESFVWKDFATFRHAPSVLSNPRLFEEYPRLACQTFEALMAVGENPKPRLSTTLLKQLRNKHTLSLIKDIFGMRRL
jgi:electron transfer flavoprotein-quinone oxidoreductase